MNALFACPARAPRRRGAALFAALVLALAQTGAWAQAALETVRFQDYPGFGNLLVRIAISKGYCAKNGIECKLLVLPSSPMGIQGLLAGSIDAALPSVDAVNQAVLRGSKMKYVAGGAVASSMELVAGNHWATPHAAEGFPAFIRDLKGAKIGVPGRGAPNERYMSMMLTQAGLDPEKDVTFVAVGGATTAYNALVSKQVDAVLSYEPMGSICKVLETCKVLWRSAFDRKPEDIFAINGGANGTVFLQDFIDRKPKIIDSVIRLLQESETFVNNPAHFEEILRIDRPYFSLEMPRGDEIMTASLHVALDANMYRAHMSRKAMKAALDLMLASHQLPKVLPVSDLILDRAP
ncbi:MAG: ABC transporter substrate-binding protein [Burkholderiales bacterium]|nr:ABC transporter substrate-binding protein [Burkholderiales bacterium]